MKMDKTIEVTVCEQCGKELHKYYHLSFTIYDYQSVLHYKDLEKTYRSKHLQLYTPLPQGF